MIDKVSKEIEMSGFVEGYPYKYEVHMHTVESSACGRTKAKDYITAFLEQGYDGMIITDHFFYGNTAVDRTLPWEDFVEEFCKGYELAKEEGDGQGLKVFFGWEANYQGTEFLINGLSKEWLLAHPEIVDCTIPEQFELVHAAGGMVVHCHPFREEPYIPEVRLFPEYTDAVETVNATHSSKYSMAHNNPEFDVKAREYAEKYNFPQTAGSDIHRTDVLCGGIAFSRKLSDSSDYIRAVMGREKYVLLTGNED